MPSKKIQTAKDSEQREANIGRSRQGKPQSDDRPSRGSTAPRRSARNASKQTKNNPTTSDSSPGLKRKRADEERPVEPSKQQGPVKKQKQDTKNSANASEGKTVGSKHDKAEAPAAQGSNKRLPKEGATVSWKAMPGWVEGQVLQILTEDKQVEGKKVKASKNEPRIVLKSNAKSGKV